MIRIFFRHYILSLKRSPMLTREAIQAGILVLFALYAAVSYIIMGMAAGAFFETAFPGREPVHTGLAALMFYFFGDVLMRYFFQKYPALQVNPYLLLPVPKASITHYVLLRSAIHFFNVLPLFAAVPFALMAVVPSHGPVAGFGFILASFSLALMAGYTGLFINMQLGSRSRYIYALLTAIAVLMYLEYSGSFSTLGYLIPLAASLTVSPALYFIWPLLLITVYFAMHKPLMAMLGNTATSAVQVSAMGAEWSWLNRFGGASPVMQLELHIMRRSPRARSYVLSSFLIALLPLFMGMDDLPPYVLVFYGFIITGIIALNHGQLILSWNSTHFDLLLSRGIGVQDIFYAKYYILLMACAAMWLVCIPYYFFYPEFLLYFTALALFNCTASVYGYMLLAVTGSRRIDPSAGGLMSMDGFGMGHYLIILPLIAVPMILFAIGHVLVGEWLGVFILAAFGILGIALHKGILGVLIRIFNRNKYQLAAAFRNRD